MLLGVVLVVKYEVTALLGTLEDDLRSVLHARLVGPEEANFEEEVLAVACLSGPVMMRLNAIKKYTHDFMLPRTGCRRCP